MARFMDVVDVPTLLTEPEVTEVTLDVPSEWRTWDEMYQSVRDAANKFISLVNKIPEIDLPSLPDGSLEDLVVKPFTGDWDRIRQNGAACQIFGKGIQGMASNLVAIPVQMGDSWSGQAADSFRIHHAAYAVVMGACGELVKTGQLIFEAVGDMSQQLGETAIRILVPLGRLLIRISGQIAKRFGGWFAWASTAVDVARNGLDPVIDIYNGIIHIVTLIEDLVTLKDRVTAWVEAQSERLKMFSDLPSLLDQLPVIVAGEINSLPTEADPDLQSDVDEQVAGADTGDTSATEDLQESIDESGEHADEATTEADDQEDDD